MNVENSLESIATVASVYLEMGAVGYLLSAVAYLGLLALIWSSRADWSRKRLVAISSALTAIWAASTSLSMFTHSASMLPFTFEVFRNLGWLFFLGQLLRVHKHGERGHRFTLTVFFIAGIASVVPILFHQLMVLADLFPSLQSHYATVSQIAHVTLPVLGLLLVENLYRNADEDGRWAVKHLCFGLSTLFGFDFFLYADASLFNRLDNNIYLARGFVDAFAVPLIAISVSRIRSWEVEIHLSRRVVFHTAALVGSGLYLIVMAGVGYLARTVDQSWGPMFQIVFLVGAGLVTLLLYSSGAVRSRVRVWIAKHFFQYTHDYREVWLRFTHVMSDPAQGAALNGRIIRAVADIFDCTSAGLWEYREGDKAFLPTARWNLSGALPGEAFPGISEEAPMVGYLRETKWVVDLADYRADPESYDGLEPPDWLVEHQRAQIILPLFHRDELEAFLVLGQPRTPIALDWETLDLLKTVGRQAAGYLAEEHAVSALSDARRLEAFNRRSAFIIHDIKNLVSQMSLMVQNAEKYGHDPEFQKDMQMTVRNSVERMKELLAQFKAENAEDGILTTEASSAFNEQPAAKEDDAAEGLERLRTVVEDIAAIWQKQKSDMDITLEDPGILLVDRERMTAALNHLLQNAIEAAGAAGLVALGLFRDGHEVVVEVSDDGPGMDPDFVRDKLFRPLETAKDEGYGLGAFQTRQMVVEMGGRLDVVTAPGHGTKMRIILQAP
ncbi:XrtA/PEP-CTERM system histidine kinase PrsK [Magnetospira sp. QH-2]|uniref:XrtA/PEP-CTERM system histidine kinase PrsK n=1 Tax=Magnetospira sp. (strain QH-2) TaxID=1288970 RepID=UPI0003E81BF0|nr:XrtA/PEP-CTERM system histidine kinase PrsK [Magnetospira sp. QH-2]CCQ72872.1 putative histidine kinase [Magnetospira sp. QH-2]